MTVPQRNHLCSFQHLQNYLHQHHQINTAQHFLRSEFVSKYLFYVTLSEERPSVSLAGRQGISSTSRRYESPEANNIAYAYSFSFLYK